MQPPALMAESLVLPTAPDSQLQNAGMFFLQTMTMFTLIDG
jgi:hypothetical protein